MKEGRKEGKKGRKSSCKTIFKKCVEQASEGEFDYESRFWWTDDS